MYAIIATSGRQYRVNKSDVIDVDLMSGKEGETVTFKEVLAAGEGKDIQLGTPTVKGVTVTGEIIKHFRGPKLIAFKIKRRKGYRKTKGHRSELTRVKITSIEA
ncbi:MAG: 50S ribosomal protein L21 [Lentisphaerota bacterium]|jgi:large subunit ribosomal protein L21